ncbi:MAG: cation:dicarboxylase symporter family transporter [Clostridia bacterium]|nr:cation:dicarboxylase symporter family transporter [Clostridia bacterium]
MEKLKTRVFFAFLLGAIAGLFIYSISNNESVRVMEFIDYGIYGYKFYVFFIQVLMLPMIVFATINATKMLIHGLENSTIGFYTLRNFITTTVFAITFSTLYSQWIQRYAPVDISVVTRYTNGLMSRGFELVHLGHRTEIMRHVITPQIVMGALVLSVLIGYMSKRPNRLFSVELDAFFKRSQRKLSDVLDMVIRLIYIPVFIYVMTVFGLVGIKSFAAAIFYAVGMTVALLIFGGLMYGALIKLGTPVGLREMLKKIQPLAQVISKTSSSTEVLPVTISTVVNKFNVDEKIADFVLRLGQNMNRDGTAIMQCFSAIVMAKFYGVTLGWPEMIGIIGLTFLLAQGSFNIPYDGILTLSIIFYVIGIPVEGIFLILGVDKGIEIIRIVINVSGDIITALLVEHWCLKNKKEL